MILYHVLLVLFYQCLIHLFQVMSKSVCDGYFFQVISKSIWRFSLGTNEKLRECTKINIGWNSFTLLVSSDFKITQVTYFDTYYFLQMLHFPLLNCIILLWTINLLWGLEKFQPPSIPITTPTKHKLVWPISEITQSTW
jgi:hypothetical protein